MSGIPPGNLSSLVAHFVCTLYETQIRVFTSSFGLEEVSFNVEDRGRKEVFIFFCVERFESMVGRSCR